MKSIRIFIFFTFAHFAWGQAQVWPLQKCIDVALQQSLDQKIKQLEVKRTERAKTTLLHTLLPTVDLYGNHSYNFGSTIDPSTNGRVSSNIQYDNFYLNARINLLDFASLATNSLSKINTERAKAEQAVFENEYKLQIAESYYQSLYAQELVTIKENQLQNTQYNLARIEKEVATGSKPKSDLYDIQLAVSQEEQQLVESKQSLRLLKLNLFQLINENIDIDTVVLEQTLAQNTSDKKQNPKIALAEINHRYSTKNIKFQYSNSLPSLTAYYQLATFYSRILNQPQAETINFNHQIDDNKNHEIGLRLSIPVFGGFKNAKQINAYNIEADKNKTALENEKQKIDKQLALEQEKIKQFEELNSHLANTLELAKLSYKTSQTKFEVGKIEAAVFTSVKNQLLQSQYDVLKNQLMKQFTQIKINLLKTDTL